jgi:hypothetical protein
LLLLRDAEFGTDAQYNAFKKRQKDSGFSKEEYEKKKAQVEAKVRSTHPLSLSLSLPLLQCHLELASSLASRVA